MKKAFLIFMFLMTAVPLMARAESTCVLNITVELDVTAPQTQSDSDSAWHKEDFTINLTAADTQSGVKETYYRLNGGAASDVSVSGQPFISTEGGGNTLEFWSVDNCGNEELPHSLITDIKLDKTPPAVEILSPDDEVAFDEGPIAVSGSVTDALSGIQSVKVSAGGADYDAAIDPDGTFSAGDAAIIGGPNAIIALAKDAAGNEAQDRISVFLGWVLHMRVPYCQEGDHHSGAAAAQIILNYIRSGLKGDLSQEEIYNYGRPHNYPENSTLPEMDPNAVDYALGHFDPYDITDPGGGGDPYRGYNFGAEIFENGKFTGYLRDIVHWMAFPVTIDHWWMDGELVKWPNTPAAVPVYGTYDHWIVINGAATTANPIPKPHTNPWYTPDFTVYGLWLTDPASGGIGQDLYVTAQTVGDTYLFPLNTSDRHNGKYLQVAEPPEVQSEAEAAIAQPKVNKETLQVIEIARETAGEIPDDLPAFENRLESARKHLYDAALVVDLRDDDGACHDGLLSKPDGTSLDSLFVTDNASAFRLDWRNIVDSSLLTDAGFVQAFDGSQARSFVKVRREDKEDSFYYLIPFDKYVKGQFLTYAAVIINAEDGSFREASWVKEPVRFIQVTRERALELAMPEYDAAQPDEKADIELVWKPGGPTQSPFYPYWKIVSADMTCFVTQNQEVIREDE